MDGVKDDYAVAAFAFWASLAMFAGGIVILAVMVNGWAALAVFLIVTGYAIGQKAQQDLQCLRREAERSPLRQR